ncbi:MAG: hypothetical protein CVU39_20750 [Chloroflexi bacterium HGW-Chloroflexi-10]|nr:MAG: hypothetical protein CVU39_20750 [Chloroflexi bacterium HGW-Chloroflexi-10]
MPGRVSIHTLSDLENWLQENDISVAGWGEGYAKTIQRLFTEIQKGECHLQNSPPLRVLPVVQLMVYQNGKILVEKEQMLSDCRIRKRKMLPSEKMKPNEDWHSAALRCLEEELATPANQAVILTQVCKPVTRKRTSQSYPGLESLYFLYRVEMQLGSLPQEDFWTSENSGREKEQAISRHLWGWMDPDEVKF